MPIMLGRMRAIFPLRQQLAPGILGKWNLAWSRLSTLARLALSWSAPPWRIAGRRWKLVVSDETMMYEERVL
jgi:hypothetical protein